MQVSAHATPKSVGASVEPEELQESRYRAVREVLSGSLVFWSTLHPPDGRAPLWADRTPPVR